jgi:hypothetical protein
VVARKIPENFDAHFSNTRPEILSCHQSCTCTRNGIKNCNITTILQIPLPCLSDACFVNGEFKMNPRTLIHYVTELTFFSDLNNGELQFERASTK